ncbi:hypothetical protein JHW43_005281 [Diplocarpon mali]|nr:hypothetical protein JHW43_005281 [Diplocarpon mali]
MATGDGRLADGWWPRDPRQESEKNQLPGDPSKGARQVDGGRRTADGGRRTAGPGPGQARQVSSGRVPKTFTVMLVLCWCCAGVVLVLCWYYAGVDAEATSLRRRPRGCDGYYDYDSLLPWLP